MLCHLLFLFIRLLPSFLRLRLYLALKELSINIYEPNDFFVQRLPLGIYLKQGNKASQEALAIRLVAKHNSTCQSSDDTIPVPEILDVVQNVYIMTRLEGEVLGDLLGEMNQDEVAQVRLELGRVVRILRGIPHLNAVGADSYSGVVSGPTPDLPCCDVNRIDRLEFGPFPTVREFHSFLLQWVPPNVVLRDKFSISHGVSSSTPDNARSSSHPSDPKLDEPTVFTHGDLNLRNILIKRRPSLSSNDNPTSTIVISGIIDWTCAGWYPMYWEHTKAIYPQARFKMWTDLWAGIAEDTVPEERKEKYREEVELEKEMWRYID